MKIETLKELAVRKQTRRDSATRREFSVFKNKENRQRVKTLQDMQTK
jgi:hypothetical protein